MGGAYSGQGSAHCKDGEATSNQPGVVPAKEIRAQLEDMREEIIQLMKVDNYDDGSLGPIFIRLAWHSSGTYCAKSKTGGSNGATMRFDVEANDPENAGLDYARKALEPIKQKFPGFSYSDIWVFAAYVFIEESGGPKIVERFKPGRKDRTEKDAIKPGRLPGAEKNIEPGVDEEGRANNWPKLAEHIREVFYRMGFNDQEIVALMCGGHMYGRCHTTSSGYAGAWVEEPLTWSNEYAADLVGDTWKLVTNDTLINGKPVHEEIRPAKGKWQYVGVEASIKAPDVSEFKPGKYKIDCDWVNVRRSPDVGSPIIGRPEEGEEFNILSIKLFGTAVRGRLDVGGWVSVQASGGAALFERVGDLELEPGTYRIVSDSAPQVWPESLDAKPQEGDFKDEEIEITEITAKDGEIYGFVKDKNCFVNLFAQQMGVFHFDRVKAGWNDKKQDELEEIPKPNQMMLISDMVMLWDDEFRKYTEMYAEEEDDAGLKALTKDFGDAYVKLTELGFKEFPEPLKCPWMGKQTVDF